MQQQKLMVSSTCIKQVGVKSVVNHKRGSLEAVWHNAFCTPENLQDVNSTQTALWEIFNKVWNNVWLNALHKAQFLCSWAVINFSRRNLLHGVSLVAVIIPGMLHILYLHLYIYIWARVAQSVKCLPVDWTSGVQSLAGAKDFSSSPLHPEWLWSSSSLLSNVYQGSYLQG
jgi:hypothetical protein